MQAIKRVAIALALGGTFLLGDGLSATSQMQPVPNVPQSFFAIQNSARDFFRAGRKQLDEEIRLLNQRALQVTEDVLKIDEDAQIESQVEDLENLDELKDGPR